MRRYAAIVSTFALSAFLALLVPVEAHYAFARRAASVSLGWNLALLGTAFGVAIVFLMACIMIVEAIVALFRGR